MHPSGQLRDLAVCGCSRIELGGQWEWVVIRGALTTSAHWERLLDGRSRCLVAVYLLFSMVHRDFSLRRVRCPVAVSELLGDFMPHFKGRYEKQHPICAPWPCWVLLPRLAATTHLEVTHNCCPHTGGYIESQQSCHIFEKKNIISDCEYHTYVNRESGCGCLAHVIVIKATCFLNLALFLFSISCFHVNIALRSVW